MAPPHIRLAISQFRPHKGEYAQNVARIGGVITQASRLHPPPELIVFPETATSGYFVEGGVKELAVTAGALARDLAAAYAGPTIDVAIGFYERFQNHIYNSALYVTLGKKKPEIRHVHRKVFLPTYGVFDEERFVDRGQDGVRAFETSWGGTAAILICEDAWHSLAATVAALEGAQLIIVPSASPARGMGGTDDADCDDETLPASVVRWERIVRGIAEEHGVFVALANLVGFEGGKGFPGASAVIDPNGKVLVRGPLFEEALVTADIDLDALTNARSDSPLLADLQSALPVLTKSLSGSKQSKPVKFDPAPNGSRPTPHDARATQSTVVQPESQTNDPLAIEPELVKKWLASFLRDEVLGRRGFQKGIVGISGGVDSALTAVLAVEALGKDNVIGVRMPYKTSSPESLEHAQLVIDKLGIEALTIDITAAVDGYFKNVGGDEHRLGNVMARERMIVLFDLSAKYKALPLGTSNKSERLLGYFTWHGDDAPPVNPLGDLFKTQVWELARYVGVPDEIVNKPATADLIKGQTDEGDLGVSYRQADRILHHLIRGEEPVGFSPQEVEIVRKRLDSTHWKRRLPTVAVLSQTAIGEFYLRPVDY